MLDSSLTLALTRVRFEQKETEQPVGWRCSLDSNGEGAALQQELIASLTNLLGGPQTRGLRPQATGWLVELKR